MGKILEVLTIPDERLRNVAEPVEKIDNSIISILDDMKVTLPAADAMALAATQVNIAKRLVVVDLGYIRAFDQDQGKTYEELKLHSDVVYLINPKITLRSKEKMAMNEGCVSVPGSCAEVERTRKITYEYMDINGKVHKVEASGIESACIQHELDHLDGVLYIDHLSQEERNQVIEAVLVHRQQLGKLVT